MMLEEMEVEENSKIDGTNLLKMLKAHLFGLEHASREYDKRSYVFRTAKKLKMLREEIKDTSIFLDALKPVGYPSDNIYDLLSDIHVVEWMTFVFKLEGYAFITILILMNLIDTGKKEQAMKAANFMLEYIITVKVNEQFTQSPLAPKFFHLCAMAFENCSNLELIVPILQQCYDRALQFSNMECQATLLNLLLRSCILQKHFERADKMSVMRFPDRVSNNESARYLYYIGRIRVIKLNYAEAYDYFQMALRRAPQKGVDGFHQTVSKFLVVVQLLMGEIPDRKLFFQENLKAALSHYYKLAYAVKIGRMDRFDSMVQAYSDRFKVEGTLSLISRLHHNVIRTGLRSISAAYSKISMSDVAEKLALDDCSHYVEKAIYSGVIEAKLTNNGEILHSTANTDVYTTCTPLNVFDKRISFCLSLHDQFRRAMRYRNREGL